MHIGNKNQSKLLLEVRFRVLGVRCPSFSSEVIVEVLEKSDLKPPLRAGAKSREAGEEKLPRHFLNKNQDLMDRSTNIVWIIEEHRFIYHKLQSHGV